MNPALSGLQAAQCGTTLGLPDYQELGNKDECRKEPEDADPCRILASE
jgi:hypothetical protein